MVKNLKGLRIEKGISQQQLAALLGLSQQSINKYENHQVEPDITTLCAMADFFHCSIDYLVGRSSQREETLSHPYNLSYEEAMIVDCFRELSRTERTCIATLVEIHTKKRGTC